MRRTLLLPLLALLLAPPAARAGGLFVAGQQSRNILEYDEATGAFSRSFAETLEDGFENPGGIALRPSDGVLYVTSRASGEIWRYTTGSGAVQTPAAASGLFSPAGCDFDPSGGTLYFADAADGLSETVDAVKRLTVPGGAVSVVGSTSNAEFEGVAVSGPDVFATDVEGHRLVRFPLSGGSGTTVVGTGLDQPSGILFRSATRMLIADRGSDRVLEYLESGGSWSLDRVVLAAAAGVNEPCGLALAPDGRLSVSGCGSDDVVLVDLVSLAVTPLVAPGAGGLVGPKDLSWSGSTLLAASAAANAVIYFDLAGSPTGVRASGRSPILDGGIAFRWDGERVAAASLSENEMVEYDAQSGLPLRTFPELCDGFPFPYDLLYGADGWIYVGCFLSNSVRRLDPATGSVEGFVFPGSGGLMNPRGLAFGPGGNLFATSSDGRVLEYSGADGSFLGEFVDATGNGGGPIDPYGLVFHGGRLYVASNFLDEVKAYQAGTGAFVSTFVPSGSGGLDGPTGLGFGPDGDLYVASQDDDAVRRYDGASGAFAGVFVSPGSGGLDAPVDLAFRPVPPPVPALPGWALPVLAAGLALGAVRVARSGRAS